MLEEQKIIVIEELLVVMEQVNAAVISHITNTSSKQSKGRILYGAMVQHASVVSTLKKIQDNLLTETASKNLMC